MVNGPETATVVAPPARKILTDSYGRCASSFTGIARQSREQHLLGARGPDVGRAARVGRSIYIAHRAEGIVQFLGAIPIAR